MEALVNYQEKTNNKNIKNKQQHKNKKQTQNNEQNNTNNNTNTFKHESNQNPTTHVCSPKTFSGVSRPPAPPKDLLGGLPPAHAPQKHRSHAPPKQSEPWDA